LNSNDNNPETTYIKADKVEAMDDLAPPIVPRNRWQRMLHWEHLGLVVIIAITLAFHFIAIERPHTIIWDEKWYVGDARSIVSDTGELRPEHPPLAKLFVAAGEYIFNGFKAPEKDTGAKNSLFIDTIETNPYIIDVSDAAVFKTGTTIRIEAEQMDIKSVDAANNQISVERGAGGTTVANHTAQQTIYVYTDNAFGWRFFSVVFGTAGIVLFYFICRRLKLSWKTTMLATFLFAFEDMTFIHSGLALLDVYMVTFMLAAIFFYLNEGYILSGMFIALSAECKLTGVLIVIALFLHWAIYRRDRWQWFAGSLVSAAIFFLFFLVIFDYFIYGHFENPFSRIYAMLNGTAINDFTVPKLSISSRPWTWIYPQWVQLYYNSPNVPFIVYSYDPQYISFISSTVQILIVPTIGYMIYRVARGSKAAGLVLLWFLAMYLVWIPLDIATNRVTFVFYFLPATPAICIGLGMGLAAALERLKARREWNGRLTPGVIAGYSGISLYLLIHFAVFIVFNPAIPTIIKTWLPPFTIGVSPTESQESSVVTSSMLPLLFFSLSPLTRMFKKKV
jgi:dolichyl-phosphate-mannose--protein O-mannosyl transferase